MRRKNFINRGFYSMVCFDGKNLGNNRLIYRNRRINGKRRLFNIRSEKTFDFSRQIAHYLKGGLGRVPNEGSLKLLPNKDETVTLNGKSLDWGNYFTAKNSLKVCSGKHGNNEIENRPKGDGHNPAHLANPEAYKWQRVVMFENMNPLWGESCVGKAHFDCIDFVRWCLRKVNPCFMGRMDELGTKSIKGLRRLLEPVGDGTLNPNDLCVGDILIRKSNGHIGFAVGDGQQVIQAEWEASGVVETKLGNWEFHGRIPRGYWLFMPPPLPKKK